MFALIGEKTGGESFHSFLTRCTRRACECVNFVKTYILLAPSVTQLFGPPVVSPTFLHFCPVRLQFWLKTCERSQKNLSSGCVFCFLLFLLFSEKEITLTHQQNTEPTECGKVVCAAQNCSVEQGAFFCREEVAERRCLHEICLVNRTTFIVCQRVRTNCFLTLCSSLSYRLHRLKRQRCVDQMCAGLIPVCCRKSHSDIRALWLFPQSASLSKLRPGI